ncbi:MAG: hypothetical protein EWV75_19205 [Microcystis wesenbergii Mw_QC_S_20081001_S30D]|uniref:Uncharacterized protein n=2 Tax=Microcystis wesenbergii TaxID=44823 RepID=A0A552MBI3_9CHRO|nr:MAG: hypothetical protein EWV75_19205 [Microcystis wesenbergii Mw_QC_S_20081001_S30D]TRV00879.1 MAG: hypothetical protein EWV74_11570 [Microcystis wesenbergii Mw_QC_S_20081001_S30]TRV01953.1 MAG: hypothetical protein EWV73_08155 [Microcystis wesenbergii Mw_QC_B_20070930_S4D]TRV13163.1 MAG: hypothetical protein EWV41_02910 [Microcystis wesenbergii Mw_MB_S_20031200_S109]TRV14386.1 MAG: hypothetical protein EWV89_09470 [Microcystis wesenbergii Mw_QC_B_20070930_S4]TRV29824.1 MAG: hypothetical p
MLYLGILRNFMPIFLIFALSKINYARTLINRKLLIYKSRARGKFSPLTWNIPPFSRQKSEILATG